MGSTKTIIASGTIACLNLPALLYAQDAVNRTLLGGTFEVIGLGVTGWFVYRYLVNATDRCCSFLSQVPILLQHQCPANQRASEIVRCCIFRPWSGLV